MNLGEANLWIRQKQEQAGMLESAIRNLYPDEPDSIGFLDEALATDEGIAEFTNAVFERGRDIYTEALLSNLGLSPQDINEFFSPYPEVRIPDWHDIKRAEADQYLVGERDRLAEEQRKLREAQNAALREAEGIESPPWMREEPRYDFPMAYPEKLGLPADFNELSEAERVRLVHEGLPEVLKHHSAGWGDVLAMADGALSRIGMGGGLTERAKALQDIAPVRERIEPTFIPGTKIPNPGVVRDVSFWYEVVRTMPFMEAAVTLGLLGGGAGASLTLAAGMTPGMASSILASLGAGGTSAVFEGLMEAGGVYQEALDRGYSKAMAAEAFDKVLLKNVVTLTGTNALEWLLVFSPAGGVSKSAITRLGSKMWYTGLTQGGEEVLQEVYQRNALGDAVVWDENLARQAMIGFTLGFGEAGGGAIFTSFADKEAGLLPPKLEKIFTTARDKAIKAGKSEVAGFLDGLVALDQSGKEGKEAAEKIVDKLAAERIKEETKFEPEPTPVVTPPTQAPVTPKVTPTEAITIMEVESSIAISKTIEGIRYELFKGITDNRAALRITDVDTGSIVALKQYPSFDQAQAEFNDTVTKAETGTKPQFISPARIPDTGIQAGAFGVSDKEVSQLAKGVTIQQTMDDQVKLNEARRQAGEEVVEEIDETQAQTYQLDEELAVLEETLATDPLANERFKVGNRQVGIDFFISIREQSFPETFTVKQAQSLYPGHEFVTLTKEGKVPRDAALDDLTKRLNMEPDEIAERAEQIRADKNRIKELRREIVSRPEPVSVQVVSEAEDLRNYLDDTYTTKEIEAYLTVMESALYDPQTKAHAEAVEQLQKMVLGQRIGNWAVRTEQLVIEQGLSWADADLQARSEFMSGTLPNTNREFIKELTQRMKAVFYARANQVWMGIDEFERMSAYTALGVALSGGKINRTRGKGNEWFPHGGSQWDRLLRLFGHQPLVMQALDRGVPFENVVEAIVIEYQPPVPVDQQTADYLRSLSNVFHGQEELSQAYNKGGEAIAQTLDFRTTLEKQRDYKILELGIKRDRDEITQDEYDLEVAIAKEKADPYPEIKYNQPAIDGAVETPSMVPIPDRHILVKFWKAVGLGIVDIGNAVRATLASADYSWWRQAAPLIVYNWPNFIRANILARKVAFTDQAAEAHELSIQHHPYYTFYDKLGLDFLRPVKMPKGTAQWKGVEEFGFASAESERLIPRLTAKLPWVKLSQRIFSPPINDFTWNIFVDFIDAQFEISRQIATGEKILKPGEVFDMMDSIDKFGRMLEDMSGRARVSETIGKLAPISGGLFFSLRLNIGRILSGRHLFSSNKYVRVKAWKNLMSFVSVFAGVIMLGKWLDLWDVETDPRSANFMKIRVGNVRIDPWGGYQQFAVFLARVIVGTGISSQSGAEYTVNPLSAIQNLVRGKLSPLAGAVTDFWTGKTFLGEEIDITNVDQWLDRTMPFALRDIMDAWNYQHLTGVFMSIPAIFGANVMTYSGDWDENWDKIGTPKYPDNLAYNMPVIYYTTDDWWVDTASQFRGVDPATLTAEKGYPDQVRALAETIQIQDKINDLPNEAPIKINADSADGLTYMDYYQQWKDREKIVASGDEQKLKEFDDDERTRNANLGNMTQQQYALLMEYWQLKEELRDDFVDKHPGLAENPRHKYLVSHPNDNALLALFGVNDTKVYTKAAYDELNRLVDALDIPDNALPDSALPPETAIDTHFTYQEYVADGRHNSWESQLLLLEDAEAAEEAGNESYADWADLTLSETPIEGLRLKVDNRALIEQKESYSDKEGSDFKDDTIKNTDGLTERDIAIQVFYDDNPGFREDELSIKAYDNDVPNDMTLDEYVDLGLIADAFGDNSSEVKKFKLEHPELFAWGQNVFGWDDGKAWNKRILDLQVDYRKDFEAYDKLTTEEDRQAMKYTDDNKLTPFGIAHYTVDARSLGYSESQWNQHIEFSEQPTWGSWRDRWLVDPNNSVYAAEYYNKDIGGHVPMHPDDIANIKPEIYDQLYLDFKDDFEAHDAIKYDRTLNEDQKAQQREGMLLGNRDFGDAYYMRQAYGIGLAEDYVADYAEWFLESKASLKRPEDWRFDFWFVDDWWLMEHIPLIDAMIQLWEDTDGKAGWNPIDQYGRSIKDFSKVPSRHVLELFFEYDLIPSTNGRVAFRQEHPELDAWGQIYFDWQPAEGREVKRVEGWPSAAVDLIELRARLEELERIVRSARITD